MKERHEPSQDRPDKTPPNAAERHLKKQNQEHDDELVDEASKESFPASDAPGWHQTTAEPTANKKRPRK